MRRAWVVVFVVGLASSGLLALPAGAAPPTWPATFRGLTAPQRLPVEFRIVEQEDGSLGLRAFDVDLDISCPIGESFGAEVFGLMRPALPLDGRALAIHEIWGNVALSLSFRVTPQRLRGDVDFAIAAFTPDEELQRCDSGSQRLTASRVEAAAPTVVSTRDVELRQVVTVDHGAVSITRPAAASTTAADVRYRGKTSQRRPMSFVVHERRSGRREIREAVFEFAAACDDGTEGETWGIAAGWYPGLPVHHGRFVYDDVGFDAAFHWSGHVGPEAARGAFRFSVPAFTQDEQLQVCGSADLAWRAYVVT